MYSRRDLTKWRTHLFGSQNQSPSWRVLHTSPVTKSTVLHRAMDTKVFVAKLRSDVSTLCMLWYVPDAVFHCFFFKTLFQLLHVAFSTLGFTFSKTMFMFGVKYFQQKRACSHFLIGQTKLSIWESSRLKEEGHIFKSVNMFKALVESRIQVECAFSDNARLFPHSWCVD